MSCIEVLPDNDRTKSADTFMGRGRANTWIADDPERAVESVSMRDIYRSIKAQMCGQGY